MPIYKKISGSYVKIGHPYVKDESGNYFDPLGGVYVKQGGSYYLVYPTGNPLFMMGICNESSIYDASSTRNADSDYWENIVIPSKSYPLPSVMFMPYDGYWNGGDLDELWPIYPNLPTYVSFEKTYYDIVGSEMETYINSMVSEYGKESTATLYIYVDNSGSMRWSDVESSVLGFLTDLGVTHDSGNPLQDGAAYYSGNGWNVVLELKSERWLKYFGQYAYSFTGN